MNGITSAQIAYDMQTPYEDSKNDILREKRWPIVYAEVRKEFGLHEVLGAMPDGGEAVLNGITRSIKGGFYDTVGGELKNILESFWEKVTNERLDNEANEKRCEWIDA